VEETSQPRTGEVVPKPFYDPKKSIATGATHE